MIEDRFIFVDIETTGLNHMTDVVLEIGVVVTDQDLKPQKSANALVFKPGYLGMMDDFVRGMHDKSGLIGEITAKGKHPDKVEETVVRYLKEVVEIDPGKEPMCGSSVHFDRAFLREQYPAVDTLFSYRNVDVSTVKELCKRLNPRVFLKLEELTSPKKLHRAVPDCLDTIDELQFYRNNFLWVAG